MESRTKEILSRYCKNYDFVESLKDDIVEVFDVLDKCLKNGNKILVCGNGGSAADADHIVAELMKGFNKKRPVSGEIKKQLAEYGQAGEKLAENLQGTMTAINLCAHTSLMTAVINDIGSEEVFAQQILGYGCANDVLIGISTSGNSKNILNAGIVSRVKKIKTIAFTGAHKQNKMSGLFDYSLCMPSDITSDIQDMHSIVYHLLCAMLEAERWSE